MMSDVMNDIVARMHAIHKETLAACPWVALRGRSELRTTEMLNSGSVVVIPPSAAVLEFDKYALPIVFIHPDDLRILEQTEQRRSAPFFSYKAFHGDVAAIFLWLSRQTKETK